MEILASINAKSSVRVRKRNGVSAKAAKNGDIAAKRGGSWRLISATLKKEKC